MADALVTPAVAGGCAALAGLLTAVAIRRLRRNRGTTDVIGTDDLVPLMGVMGAFVFAAQMINFSIPGTGSSGHIVGGIMLAAVLGPWAALLVMSSVLIVQCLLFADGGLMALGCNLLNMGVCSTIVAYPLIFKPIVGNCERSWRIVAASVAASVVAMELGAVLTTAETALSGITALPARHMLPLMTAIHLFIGIGEGLATAALLCFVRRCRPSLLVGYRTAAGHGGGSGYLRCAYVAMGVALALGAGAAWVASAEPDGLEWSIERLAGTDGIQQAGSAAAHLIAGLQQKAALMPDYDSTWAGIGGCCAVLALVWLGCSLFTRLSRHRERA